MLKSICFFLALFIVLTSNVCGEWNPVSERPSSFGTPGRTVEDLREFAKPNQMMDIVPHRPIAARDKYGNRLYFSPSGKMTLKVSSDGVMQFSLGNKSIKKDADGNIVTQSKVVQGAIKAEIKNEKGEILGYETYGLGGKVINEFDAQGNLTKTHGYDTYGKNQTWLVDELSLTRTVFDDKGNPEYDKNFEDAIVARYTSDKDNRLQSKTDIYNNKTYFDDRGNMTYTDDKNGQNLTQYFYKTDDEGRYILEKMVDETPGTYWGDTTYFENGKPVQTVSRFGGVAKEYNYDGTTLVYTYNTRSNEVTWYDINGKQVNSTFDGNVVKEWIYYKSRLVGYFDSYDCTVVLYQYEREDQNVRIFARENKPTAEEIEKYYEDRGLMTDVGVSPLVSAEFKSATIPRSPSILKMNPWKTSQQQADFVFDVVKDGHADLLSQKQSLQETKYKYSADTGKVESVLIRDPEDGNGWVTDLYLETEIVRVTGDQSNNIALADKLIDAVVNNNQNIGDIATGSGELAAFAGSVKAIIIKENKISGMTDEQISNLMGWKSDGAYTKAFIEDIRTRSNNAGYDGNVSITYGYSEESTENRIYAAVVSAYDKSSYLMSGTVKTQSLYLTSKENQEGVLIASDHSVTMQEIPDWEAVEQAGPIAYDPLSLVQNVNGFSRTYAKNGVILEEIDSYTGEKTAYDTFGRKEEIYSDSDRLTKVYYYAEDGRLQSTQSYLDGVRFVTTFFLGWGEAEKDQTTITVLGEQNDNTALAEQLWSALSNGYRIDEISIGTGFDTGLSAFARTVRTITVNPVTVSGMTDNQLSALLSINSPDSTTGALQETRRLAAEVGADGSLAIDYGSNGDNRLFGTKVSTYLGSQPVASMTLNFSYISEFSGYLDTLQQQMGLEALSDLAVEISDSLLK